MNRKNTILILGLSLPIVMILLIASIIYIPGAFYHPKYSFIYSLDRQYSADLFFVQDSKIAIQKNQQVNNLNLNSAPSQLFLYDVIKDKSQAISFEKAQLLNLDPNPISPDGYQVKNGNGVDGILPLLFISGDRAGIYLIGHNANQKLNIGTYQNSYWGFHFIGWLMP